MRGFYFLSFFLVSFGAMAASSELRLNKNGVALCEDRDAKDDSKCYDPVSYLKDQKAQAVTSDQAKNFRFKYKEATYVFVSADHLELFKKDPEHYLPQFGGWCAYAVASSKEKVDIDPSSFVIQDGRLLLFFDSFYAHTRKTWLNDTNKDPKAYLQDADRNWPSVMKKDP